MRPLLIVLLLSGCVIEQNAGEEALRVEVSSYPTEVAPGAEFSVLIDVLEVKTQIETDVTPTEGVGVVERIGTSFVILNVTVTDNATGFQEITVALRDGERNTEVRLGFSVLEDDA